MTYTVYIYFYCSMGLPILWGPGLVRTCTSRRLRAVPSNFTHKKVHTRTVVFPLY